MKKLLFALFLLQIKLLSAQNATFRSIDLSPNQSQIEVDLSSMTAVKQVKIQTYQKINNVDFLVFEGVYKFDDQDPSAFRSFKNVNGTYTFGVGFYEKGTYYCRITYTNLLNIESTVNVQ